jgi:hypothetical protein
MNQKKASGATLGRFLDTDAGKIRPLEEIYDMLEKLTLIAAVERKKGQKEHADILIAMGCGIRWVVNDFDFGLEEPTRPSIPQSKAVAV